MFYVKWWSIKPVFKKARGPGGTGSLWLKCLNKSEWLFRACYGVSCHRYKVSRHPPTAPATCLLRSMGRWISKRSDTSACQCCVLPTTRSRGRRPSCTAVLGEVMLILILTESERVVVFHFAAAYHHSFHRLSWEKHKSTTKSDVWADLEPESVRPCHLYFNIPDPKYKHTHKHASAPEAMFWGRCFSKKRKLKLSMQMCHIDWKEDESKWNINKQRSVRVWRKKRMVK